MTKKNFKIIGLMVFAVVVFTAFPVVAAPNQGANSNGVVSGKSISAGAKTLGQAFCKLAANATGKITSRIANRDGLLTRKRSEIETRLAKNRTTRDGKLAEFRTRWDGRRDDVYNKLKTMTTTDAEKAALAEFKLTVEAAVTTRKTVVDAAIKEYRDGMDKIVADHATSVDATVAAYRSAVDAAIQKAKDNCANSTDAATVRETLHNELKTARDKLKSDIQAIDNISEQLNALMETEKAAVQKAIDDFKVTYENAKNTLKTVFNEANSNSANNNAANSEQ